MELHTDFATENAILGNFDHIHVSFCHRYKLHFLKQTLHHVSKSGTLLFLWYFDKSGPNFIIFSVKFRKDLQEKLELKLPPHLKSFAAYLVKSKWSTMQLYNTVNSVQRDEKRLIMVKLHKEMYFFVFLHRLISVMCLKCLPLAHTRVFELLVSLVNGCVNVRCSMLCQTFFFITEGNE